MTGRGTPLTRRRCLTILAGACAAAAAGQAAAETPVHEWRGTAMGADARLLIRDASAAQARAAVQTVLDEVARLEAIFSLYCPGSALRRLNAAGRLDPAPLELLDLTARARWFTRATDGAFDITVQPLWELYGRHFRDHPNDRHGPPAGAIAAARALVGAHRIAVTETGILLQPGTRLTFNGIAQGYVTDRVADMLRGMGWRHVLVDLGELRALDGNGPEPWRVALPGGSTTPLTEGAIATSSADGLRFTPGGAHHLFDPRSGGCASGVATVSVQAPRATDADALSTALAVAPPARWPAILQQVPHAKVLHHA